MDERDDEEEDKDRLDLDDLEDDELLLCDIGVRDELLEKDEMVLEEEEEEMDDFETELCEVVLLLENDVRLDSLDELIELKLLILDELLIAIPISPWTPRFRLVGPLAFLDTMYPPSFPRQPPATSAVLPFQYPTD